MRCLLYPQKRTSLSAITMSTLCQKQTCLRPKGDQTHRSKIPERRSCQLSEFAEKVLQSEILPELKPFKNQRLRCAEVPWVKASGTT